MATYPLTIVSPRGKVWDQPAESVSVPGYEGELGVLAHHAPLLSVLKPGVSRVSADGRMRFFATGTGVIEVTREEVVIMVDSAEPADSLDQAKAAVQKHLAESSSVPGT